MITDALSHGLAIILCMISAAYLLRYLHKSKPKWLQKIHTASEGVLKTVKLPFTAEHLDIILLAAILGFLWGLL